MPIIKKIIELISKFFTKDIVITEPKSYGKISISDTRQVLMQVCNSQNIFLSDNSFSLTTMDEAKKFSEETKIAYKKWTSEDHDCDNFSYALQGYWSQGLVSFAYGIAWSKNDSGSWIHAFNIMIDNNKQVWIIEPQQNKYMTIEESKSNDMYKNIGLVIV